jgi:hypothetical protein
LLPRLMCMNCAPRMRFGVTVSIAAETDCKSELFARSIEVHRLLGNDCTVIVNGGDDPAARLKYFRTRCRRCANRRRYSDAATPTLPRTAENEFSLALPLTSPNVRGPSSRILASEREHVEFHKPSIRSDIAP